MTSPHAAPCMRALPRAYLGSYRQGVSPEEIAVVFLFGKFTARTVRRWIQEYQNSGIMVPSTRRLWVLRRHYSAFALQRMETLLAQNNGLKAKEVRLKVFQQTGEAASLRTVNRIIKLINWRRKVIATLSSKQNPETIVLR